ncbi:MAG: hypothetical protein M1816_002062 [Peltula sp. TS41687]|nr:MAG: hypothetical protein M1816_002062 [Peltula sp. TS41687]
MDTTNPVEQDIVRESPAKKRRKTTSQEKPETSQAGYDSMDDSGDDLFNGYETVATLPVSRPPIAQFDVTQPPASAADDDETVATVPIARPLTTQPTQLLPSPSVQVTQPTQIIDASNTQIDNNSRNPSIVQVAASSPLRPPPTPYLQSISRPRPLGGVLASAMAPAGTAFRPPLGVQRPQVKSSIIDISDDDGPIYKGKSDDDELSILSKADIKPSMFARSTSNASADGNTTKEVDKSGRTGDRFKEITSRSFYRPVENDTTSYKGTARPTSSTTTQRNGPKLSELTSNSATARTTSSRSSHSRGAKLSQLRNSSTLKRSVDARGNTSGNQDKDSGPRVQTGPERAKMAQDIALEDIKDFILRQNIMTMIRILPYATVLMCRTALLAKKGHVEDALDLITSQRDQLREVHLVDSDDELGQPEKRARTTAKREVKAPNRTIQDKWSSTQVISKPQSQPPTKTPVSTPPKSTSRTGQSRQLPSSPDPTTTRVRSPELTDESDSAVASGGEDQAVLEGKVLNFFNTCSSKDLADISNNTEEIAQVILSQKPFNSLDEIREIASETPTFTKTGKRRAAKRPIGDKIVETCLEMWTGYEAVDELVTQCEALGAPVAEEMKKWGFDIFGAAKSGELEMVSFNNDLNGSLHDSGIGTPRSSPLTPMNDEHVEGVKDEKKLSLGTKKDDTFLSQPAIMDPGITLKDYQLVGLNWLALLFKKKLSCILADEMGLGKTCQVIAFLAHLYETGEEGPHLIVVPGSTLENWLREFRRFAPSLVVEPYYGLEAERAEQRARIEDNIESINVIVTTYDLASKKVDGKFLRKLGPVVCVYDEGHALKNSTSKRYEALMRIPARFRLLLTGTPLQNNLKELAALLGFILPSVFNQRRGDLDFIFKAKARTTDDNHSALLSAQRIARAKSMMTPFVLRRKKHQVLKHLPAKTSRTEYCDMPPAQWEVYNDHLRQAREAMQARAEGKKPTKVIGNVLMQLRKAAIHPMLFRRLFTDDKIRKMAKDCLKEPELSDRDAELVLEDMSYYSDFQLHTFCEEHPKTMTKYNIQNDEWMDSGKVTKLTELLLKYRENGDRVLLFSQFTMVLDILEAVLDTLQIAFFRFDGSTKIEERQDMIDQFHEEKEVTVFLLSTKAGGMGINLACANKVIIFDQSFNPQEDIQAENRAHRVGQTREVEVVRLVSRGTVEEQIHALGETKLALDHRVAGEETTTTTEKDEKRAEEEGVKAVEKMFELSQGILGDTALGNEGR